MANCALLRICCLLGGLLLAAPPLTLISAAGEVDIIVNKANTTADLSVADARKIFLGDKTTWPSGKRVSILMLAQGQPEREVVLRDIYKMSESDYAKYFLQAAFTGKVSAPPKDIPSAAQLRQAVAENPGAHAYGKKEDLADSVKVVLRLP